MTLRAPNLGNKDRLSIQSNPAGDAGRHTDRLCRSDLAQDSDLGPDILRSAEHGGSGTTSLFWIVISVSRSVSWTGNIGIGSESVTTPSDPVVQDDKDSFSASFEFEGELDPDWTP